MAEPKPLTGLPETLRERRENPNSSPGQGSEKVPTEQSIQQSVRYLCLGSQGFPRVSFLSPLGLGLGSPLILVWPLGDLSESNGLSLSRKLFENVGITFLKCEVKGHIFM